MRIELRLHPHRHSLDTLTGFRRNSKVLSAAAAFARDLPQCDINVVKTQITRFGRPHEVPPIPRQPKRVVGSPLAPRCPLARLAL
jgi:hypothetical protein